LACPRPRLSTCPRPLPALYLPALVLYLPSTYLPSSSTCPLPTCTRPRQTVGARDATLLGSACLMAVSVFVAFGKSSIRSRQRSRVQDSSGARRGSQEEGTRGSGEVTQAAVERRREPSGTPRTQLPGARGPASRPSLTRAWWTPLRPVRYVRDPGVWSRSSAPTNSSRPRPGSVDSFKPSKKNTRNGRMHSCVKRTVSRTL